MESGMTEPARKLLDCMKKQGIGIKKTAMLSGVSRNRIRQILHGELDILIDEAAKLNTLFGTDVFGLSKGDFVYDEKGFIHMANSVTDAISKNLSHAEAVSDVDHPARYGGDTEYECIKVLKAWLNADEYRGFLKGNAIKYLCRLGKKDEPAKEIEKAVWYLNSLKESYAEEQK